MNNNWKIGDRVLSLVSMKPYLKKGNEYTIDGFGCCPKCGYEAISIKEFQSNMGNELTCCNGGETFNTRSLFGREHFIRPDHAGMIEYRTQVTVREISVPQELKKLTELQNQ